MNLLILKTEVKNLYGPVLTLDNFISHIWRRKLKIGFFILTIVGVTFSLVIYISDYFGVSLPYLNYREQIQGLTGLFFLVWAIFFLMEAFYYSFYFKEKRKDKVNIDFDLAKIVSKIGFVDLTSDFFKTKTGKLILHRCGIKSTEFSDFLNRRRLVISPENFDCKYSDNYINLRDFLLSLVDFDKELADFLFTYGIQKKELMGIAEWIMELKIAKAEQERWWSLENLSRIQSVGRDWSYGQIFNLHKYERYLSPSSYSGHSIHSSYGVKELIELESVLSRTRDANVILVSDDEAGKLQIISRLSQMILEGTSVARLHHKRLIVLDDDKLVAVNGTKASFEKEFITIMVEAINAGNIILVIEDLPSLINSCTGMGVDFASLFESYLSSPNLQIIALANTDGFHAQVERNSILIQYFETILVKDIDDSNTIKVLENEIVGLEKSGLFFTYGSLETIVESAERYFPDGVMPDKAVDLLLEITPKLLAQKKSIVEKKDILELVEIKTGIPVSGVNSTEKEKLLNLEEVLHKRIVGQDEAVKTISNAVRRARSGITNPNRPLGSFLFLGPTGVGKTETTKALADVFFGEKANVLRLDMSEYSSNDAVSKLIGSFEGKQSGVLSTMLREHQYGVLLLDEFEKTTKEVMNLFLQILDEGFFSDMNGKKIGARNLIIIATSNAGSDYIWEAMKNGEDLSKAKDGVIESIIKQGIFKPEFLNRFDGVVLFHPLEESHLRKIAELQLMALHERLAERGIDLVINQDLINYVVSFGTDPKFGARPMNRAIQEKVEEIVAKKIIEGSIPQGSKIELSRSELV